MKKQIAEQWAAELESGSRFRAARAWAQACDAYTGARIGRAMRTAFFNVAERNGCWLFEGGKNGDGYACANINNKSFRVIRAIYFVTGRTIPVDGVVMHSCDNPACINPAHLKLGTIGENNADRARKGRGRDQTGTKNNMAKLDWDTVREIRSRARSGAYHRVIGDSFGLSQTMVSRIVRGEAWKETL